jgi:plastocyanin
MKRLLNRSLLWRTLASCLIITLGFAHGFTAAEPSPAAREEGPFFLPTGDAAKVVSVTSEGEAEAGITVLTQSVAIKETGPKVTVGKFGEVYAFNPNFIAVQRDQPTQIEFWNLQAADAHDFALVGPHLQILMYVKLPPLKKTSYIFTFHRAGVIGFKCLRHQPAMSGQILVLPPEAK